MGPFVTKRLHRTDRRRITSRPDVGRRPRVRGRIATTVGPVAAAAAAVLLAPPVNAQPLTERTPNLQGTWITAHRSLHFQFAHRFRTAGGDVTDLFGETRIVNYPTFELGYGLFDGAMAGFRYSSNSLLAGQPNEWQPFVKFAPRRLSADGRPSVSFLAAWNGAAESLDGELSVQAAPGPLLLIGAARGFTDLYDLPPEREDEALALAGGAGVRLNRYVTLAADVADVVAGPHGPAAWSAGIHVGIPFTPHTVSIMATNVTSGTLQGTSTGVRGEAFWGFEFTVPFSGFARWGRVIRPEGGERPGDEPGPPAAVEAGDAVELEISGFAFAPQELRVTPGTTVLWVNRDPVAHTATADDGSWSSPLVGPGETWERTFEEPGRHSYHCAPHPFMTAVVVVEEE